jgi:hypothetical protein
MSFLFSTLTAAWIYVLYKDYPLSHRIHYLMLALVFFKTLTVICEGAMFHMIEIYGSPDGWNIAFYIFNFFRGMLFFTVVVLVGMGWSYMKPFIGDKEKRIILILVPLQVFANIAIIITGARGSLVHAGRGLLLRGLPPLSWGRCTALHEGQSSSAQRCLGSRGLARHARAPGAQHLTLSSLHPIPPFPHSLPSPVPPPAPSPPLRAEEESPAVLNWFTWRDVFHLVDIICCCAILFPIVWSIKHLREASQTDGKAARCLEKLTLFRQFYVMVVVYIYFTRIVVYLLKSTMQYEYAWVSDAAAELATLAFYVWTGVKFRPQQNNPYLKLSQEEIEL